MAKTIYSEMRKFLPKAIDDHVDRTSIARRGKGIYKRGNNRARRVLVKYDFLIFCF